MGTEASERKRKAMLPTMTGVRTNMVFPEQGCGIKGFIRGGMGGFWSRVVGICQGVSQGCCWETIFTFWLKVV